MGKKEKGKGPAQERRFTLEKIAKQEGKRNVVEHTTDHHKKALENSHVPSPPCLVESDIEVFCEKEKVSTFNETYFKKYSNTLVELFLEYILPNLNNTYDRNKKELTEADWTTVGNQFSILFDNLSLTMLINKKTTPSKALKEWRDNLKEPNNETIADICNSIYIESIKNNKHIKSLNKIYSKYKTKKQKRISDKEFNNHESQYHLFLTENEIRDSQLKPLHRYIVGIVQKLQSFKSEKKLQIYPQCKNLNTGWYTTQSLESIFEDLKKRVAEKKIQDLSILNELNTIFSDYVKSLELTGIDKKNAIASITQYGLLDICREVAWQLDVNDSSNFAGKNLFEHFKERYQNTVFNIAEYRMFVRRLKKALCSQSTLQDETLKELEIDFTIEESPTEITLQDICVDVAFELGYKDNSDSVGENLLKQFKDQNLVFNLDEYTILVDNLKKLFFPLKESIQDIKFNALNSNATRKAERYIEILIGRRSASDSSTRQITRKLSIVTSAQSSQASSPSSSSSHSYERIPSLDSPRFKRRSSIDGILTETAFSKLPYLNLTPREQRGRSQSANGNTKTQRQASFRILELTLAQEKRQGSKSLTGENRVQNDVFPAENSTITPPTLRGRGTPR